MANIEATSQQVRPLSGARAANQVEIRAMQAGEDLTAFRSLNEEWITRYFTLEEADKETLGDPETKILRKGGSILMVFTTEETAGQEPVGCVALIPMGKGVYELSKMAVAPRLRGQGIGRRLLEAAIVHAQRMGAQSLFLGSSVKLQNAVHLYESVGFHHVPPEQIPPMPYTRADVFMSMTLAPVAGTD